MNKLGNIMTWMSIFTMALVIISWYDYLKIDSYRQKEEIKKYENIVIDEKKPANQFYGYINIPLYNINRLIKIGDPDKVVDEGYIGIYGYIPNNIPNDSLMLVGHSRSNIFSVLHKIKNNDQLFIFKNNKEYQYKVEKKFVIDVDDYRFLNNIDSNQLVLITCLEDNSKRLVVIGNYTH